MPDMENTTNIPTRDATRDEAMRACVPYMLARMASRITHARKELARVERIHAAAMAAYKAATKGGEPCKP